jgi:hypothetical protein
MRFPKSIPHTGTSKPDVFSYHTCIPAYLYHTCIPVGMYQNTKGIQRTIMMEVSTREAQRRRRSEERRKKGV